MLNFGYFFFHQKNWQRTTIVKKEKKNWTKGKDVWFVETVMYKKTLTFYYHTTNIHYYYKINMQSGS